MKEHFPLTGHNPAKGKCCFAPGIFSYKVLPLDIKVVLLCQPQETRANALLNRKS